VSYRDILRPQLRVDEGVKKRPYIDSRGKTTIGVGRNLTDVGLRNDEIDLLFENDIDEAELAARKLIPNFDDLNDVRQAVVVNMAYNMGESAFATFTDTLQAIKESRFLDAAGLMLVSRWATQVGARARRLSDQMKDGE
jgi:lysozyme